MALERQSIEKKDFPIGRRGYDPDAVDAHLHEIADHVDELRRAARRRSETLASSASEQVRAIVEAAESSASEIQRQAEEEAAEIRGEATSEARRTREQASEQAREYVGRVSESTAVMLQRLDAMESELGALIESLRTGANRLGADLQLLESNFAEVSEAVYPRPRFERETSARPPAPAEPHDHAELYDDQRLDEPEMAYSDTAEAAPVEEEPAAAPGGAGDAGGEPVAPEAAARDTDVEGARLIALNMALNGTPREETDRYLAANFDLPDRSGLLDEVYASLDG